MKTVIKSNKYPILGIIEDKYILYVTDVTDVTENLIRYGTRAEKSIFIFTLPFSLHTHPCI